MLKRTLGVTAPIRLNPLFLWPLFTNLGNRLPDGQGHSARIGRIADRTADNHAVGVLMKSLDQIRGTLPVIHRLVLDRTTARPHRHQAVGGDGLGGDKNGHGVSAIWRKKAAKREFY